MKNLTLDQLEATVALIEAQIQKITEPEKRIKLLRWREFVEAKLKRLRNLKRKVG